MSGNVFHGFRIDPIYIGTNAPPVATFRSPFGANVEARHQAGASIMLLGRVIGTVVPCVCYQGLEGVPFLIVQPLDRTGSAQGKPLVVCDATRMAGPGELVAYEGGREAALALDPWFIPVDHSIVGIVDEVSRPDWRQD